MDIMIQWKDKNKWSDFDCRDINHLSRNHALSLLQQDIPVIAKQIGIYLVNRDDLYSQYKKQGKSVKYFKDCQPSERSFAEVGFF